MGSVELLGWKKLLPVVLAAVSGYAIFALPSRECDELVSQQTYLRYLEGMVSIVHSILVLTKKDGAS